VAGQRYHPLGCIRPKTFDSYLTSVERVLARMRADLTVPPTLEEMSSIAAVSPSHFDRVFRQVTGIAPSYFMSALRLEAAKKLILTTDSSVTDVCFEMGFSSLGTFVRRFTKLVGVAPHGLRTLSGQNFESYLSCLAEQGIRPPAASAPGTTARGSVRAQVTVTGPIFIGAFSSPIPQGRPAGGSLLIGVGDYFIDSLPDGRYYLLAVALIDAAGSSSLFLPVPDSVLVGKGEVPLVVKDGVALESINIELRPIRTTDPPILVALPSLIDGMKSSLL
jgi:AraC-like DNA-binding protein